MLLPVTLILHLQTLISHFQRPFQIQKNALLPSQNLFNQQFRMSLQWKDQDLKVKKKVRLMISSSKTCVSSIWLKFSFPLVSEETRKKDRERDGGSIGQARSLLLLHTIRTNLQICGSSQDSVDQSGRDSNKSQSMINMLISVSSPCHRVLVKILLDVQ